jgi:hypothetical protein
MQEPSAPHDGPDNDDLLRIDRDFQRCVLGEEEWEFKKLLDIWSRNTL